LNKSLFEAIPLFVDSARNFILLDWPYIYKGTIRDFYPPVNALPPSPHAFQIYQESLGPMTSEAQTQMIKSVGRRIAPEDLADLIDVAFLSLHGAYGEDGQIQGLLESLGIPYTGSGIRACSIGIDKAFQKKMMEAGGFDCPEVMVMHRQDWLQGSAEQYYEQAKNQIGFPMVIRPANQGSSIGVAIIGAESGLEGFEKVINRAFFRETILASQWLNRSAEQRIQYLRALTDIRDGLGFPLEVGAQTIYHPEALLETLNAYFAAHPKGSLSLEAHLSEQRVIVEGFIEGKEFSCIVLRQADGSLVALPPTEIVKGGEVFDYRSKYLPGLSRKITPIDLPDEQINRIRQECERLFDYLEFNTYARIDGFIKANGQILLNDPNTTSGMLPSSFFFHQAAEIGLNPSQFLTYIIRTSLQERIESLPDKNHFPQLLAQLDQAIEQMDSQEGNKQKIAVILGGYSFERHISVESGRNIFEKLSSSDKYDPIPIFLLGDEQEHQLYQIPINLLLKDNADDIRDKILGFHQHPVVEQIKTSCADLTRKYASKNVVFAPQKLSYEALGELVDGVFIALHGRPGEDGTVQQKLTEIGLPYNGSTPDSASLTINKYATLQTLKQHGFTVANQLLIERSEFVASEQAVLQNIEADFNYPLIAKPVDDGCSSAVKMIQNRAQLQPFLQAIFRSDSALAPSLRQALQLKDKEEFPHKNQVLIESLIQAEGAARFMEITGGLLTRYIDGVLEYEVFEPSEALAGGKILSLEEKFLAGEGQNITPARFADNERDYTYIANQVKADLERAARILKVKGYARIDAFVRIDADKNVETIIIEV
ncbi:MAG: D-alanine--D-alanine ligase, partial [Bacteroidota bacterium]